MSNRRVTAFQIAITLDFKVAINSSIGDMSGDKRRLVKHQNSICCQKIDSEGGSMSWGIVMLIHKVSSSLILIQKNNAAGRRTLSI